MSNLVEYAKKEMEIAWPEAGRDEMQSMACKNILELIQVFSDQNHSGMSAPYVLQRFMRLVNFQPLLPLTGADDEWGEPMGEENLQQNKRCGHVFRDHFDNATARDSEGRIFVDQEGISFTCKGSHVPITFPYNVPAEPERVRVLRNREEGKGGQVL